MNRRLYRIAGLLLGLSVACLLVAVVPLQFWPAPRPGDSYVFSPPRFSAIWAQRTLIPALVVTANVFVTLGLGALFRRDSDAMSRLQGAFALAALFGTGVCVLGTLLVTTAGPNDLGSELTGILVWALASLLAAAGLLGWGLGYLQSGNRRLGAALAGPPLLAAGLIAVSLAGVALPVGGRLALVVPASAMALAVGSDLWVGTDADEG
ncbi:hypothetical protein [Haloarcula brevis]|uniref:hypothetical protein n=1 Tax=Haloarcula brevis TaxID=3111453 RepID=UPI00300F5C06